MNPNDQPFSHSREPASRVGAVSAVRQAAHAARNVVIAAKRLARLYRKRLRGINGRTKKRNPRMNHLGSPFTQRRSEALRTGALLDITATAVATCMGRDQMAQQHDLAHVVIKLMAVANGANSRKGDSTRITKRIAQWPEELSATPAASPAPPTRCRPP